MCTGSSAACPGNGGQDDDGDGVDDGVDTCLGVANASQADGDNDDIGDACDPCTNIVPVFATRSRLRLTKQLTPGGDDHLSFRGMIVVPTTPAIDPTANGVRILVTDATGLDVVDVTIPGGAGWKTAPNGNRWRFSSIAGVGGIMKVRIAQKATAPGTLKFSVRGKNGSWTVASNGLPVKGTLVIDSPTATTGQCGEATPPCRIIGNGRTVLCR
jgi:hypothetical protein